MFGSHVYGPEWIPYICSWQHNIRNPFKTNETKSLPNQCNAWSLFRRKKTAFPIAHTCIYNGSCIYYCTTLGTILDFWLSEIIKLQLCACVNFDCSWNDVRTTKNNKKMRENAVVASQTQNLPNVHIDMKGDLDALHLNMIAPKWNTNHRQQNQYTLENLSANQHNFKITSSVRAICLYSCYVLIRPFEYTYDMIYIASGQASRHTHERARIHASLIRFNECMDNGRIHVHSNNQAWNEKLSLSGRFLHSENTGHTVCVKIHTHTHIHTCTHTRSHAVY